MEARAITARLAAAPADIANVSMGDATDYHPGWVYHGLIVGTAMDAASLLRQLLQGTLLEEGTLSRMLEGRPLPQFRTERYPDPAYGMGLMLHSGSSDKPARPSHRPFWRRSGQRDRRLRAARHHLRNLGSLIYRH